MNAEQMGMNWRFVARWVVIVALGFMITTALAFWSMWTLGGALMERLDAPLAALLSGLWAGGLMGLGLGLGQAVALRGTGINPTRWAIYSALGGAAGFALFSVLTATGDSPRLSLAVLAGSALGLGIGVAQWLLLRARASAALIWVPATIVAFVAAMALAYSGAPGREWLLLIAMGLVMAAVTGLAAAWLFGGRRPAIAGQLGVLLMLGLLLTGCGGADEPVVRFAEPRAGANVASPVRVVMAAENFTVEPAGDGSVHDGAGHLHIMVDTPCVEAGTTIPKDETHLHFGDGSTETALELAPGEHTLCLQAADGAHTALAGAGMTHSITVTVP